MTNLSMNTEDLMRQSQERHKGRHHGRCLENTPDRDRADPSCPEPSQVKFADPPGRLRLFLG